MTVFSIVRPKVSRAARQFRAARGERERRAQFDLFNAGAFQQLPLDEAARRTFRPGGLAHSSDKIKQAKANRARALQEFLECAHEAAETEMFMESARGAAETADTNVLLKTVTRWKETRAALAAYCSPTKQKLVATLTQGRTFTAEDSLMLELETQKRSFARNRELLRGTITEAEVIRRGFSLRTIVDRLQHKSLLAVEERGQWKFPRWQFDLRSAEGVLRGLPEVLNALDMSDLGKISWFTLPNPYLEGRTPLQALQEGDVERVVDQALIVDCR